MFKIFIVSLSGSPKREVMSSRLNRQNLSWEWIDGVRIASMDDIPEEERNRLEAYHIARLKTDPVYVCRAIGCKRAMRKALRAASQCKEDWVIILQDDAVLKDNFEARIKKILDNTPSEAQSIMLNRTGGGVKEIDGYKRVAGNVRSMTAFAVRPAYAEVMELAIGAWGGETDRIWEKLAKNGGFIYIPEPAPVQCSQKGSDIIGGIPELSYYWK